jgi:Mrp family chromosome partitioning ATPase
MPASTALTGLLGAVRRHPLLIAVVAIATVAGCLAWSSQRAPSYEASASLLVTPLPDDPASVRLPVVRESGDPTRDMQTAATLVDSPGAAARTAARMGGGWTAAAVESAVKVLPQGQSDVLDVTAKAATPAEAARLADTYAAAALDARRAVLRPVVGALLVRAEAEQRAAGGASDALDQRVSRLRVLADGTDPTLSLAQPAQPPSAPAGTSKKVLAVLALLAGAALGLVAAMATDILRSPRVTGERQLEGLTGLPVVARVPRLPAHSARAPGALPEAPAAAALPFRALGTRFAANGGPPRSIMLTSPARGDGRTTSTLQLGITLTLTGWDVLLVDLDPRAPQLARRLGVTPGPDLRHARWDEGWRDAVVDVAAVPRLHLVVADAQPEGSVSQELVAALPQLLRPMARQFDCVVIDGPSLSEADGAADLLRAVDAILVVARLNDTSERDLQRATRRLRQAGCSATGLVVVDSPAPFSARVLKPLRAHSA